MTTVTLPREVGEDFAAFFNENRAIPVSRITALRAALDAPVKPVDCRGCEWAMTECGKPVRRENGGMGGRDCGDIRTAIDILHLDTLRQMRLLQQNATLPGGEAIRAE